MSNVTIQGGVPAHILKRQQAKISRVAEAMAMPDVDEMGDRLSIRGGTFRAMREGVETEVGHVADVVIVGANPRLSKTYYAKSYDPTGPLVAPDCSSDDGITPCVVGAKVSLAGTASDWPWCSPVTGNCRRCC